MTFVSAPCMSGGNHTFSGSGSYTLGQSIPGDQDQWRWCNKCQCLAFDGYSICTSGGAHTHVGSLNYKLTNNDPNAPGQPNWKWCNRFVFLFFSFFLKVIEGCNRCYGLAYSGNGTGVCARGSGGHDFGGSGNYVLSTATQGQSDWSWCSKCQLLWYGGAAPGPCPAGSTHSKEGSGNYIVPFV